MTSSLPPLTQALTGAVGAAIANSVVYPLDLACARLHTLPRKDRARFGTGLYAAFAILRGRVRAHGLGALYDGLESDTAATVLSNFLYFYFYALLRAFALRRRARSSGKAAVEALPVAIELALGFVAGVASRAVSTPLNVITVRLQTEANEDEVKDKSIQRRKKKATPFQVLKRVYDADGLAGFWKGFASTAILSLNPALTFAFFQIVHRAVTRLSRGPSTKPGPAEAFFGAASSNALAVLLLYPLILAKTRMQAGDGSTLGALADVLQHAYADEGRGLRGVYQGLQAQLVKGFVNQGVSFLAKERVEQMLLLLLSLRRD